MNMYFVIKSFLEEIQGLIANNSSICTWDEEHNLLTEFDLKFWKVSDGSLSLDKMPLSEVSDNFIFMQ